MIDVLKPLIQQFMPFAQEKMGFDRPPKLFLRQDQQNGADPMGKTGFYDPEKESITLYTTNRHPKDIMRSLAHELMHHTQKCNGDFDNLQNMGEQGYAQADPHLRTMEIQAYQASIVFRDWEDSLKETIYYEHLQKGDKGSMSTKKWKNGELKSLLSEAWGFKMDLSKLNEGAKPDYIDLDGDGDKNEPMKKAAKDKKEGGDEKSEDLEEGGAAQRKGDPRVRRQDSDRLREEEGAFAPNHYCVHHGGVEHNGGMQMAEAIQHAKPDKNGRISHYDMKLADGTILENVAFEDIQVTNASLAEEHGKRDHNPMKDDEELDESDTGFNSSQAAAKRDYDVDAIKEAIRKALKENLKGR